MFNLKKYLINFVIILSAFIFTSALFSQASQVWVSRYNGPGNSVDQAIAIAVDAAGNVYVTGSSTGSGSNLDYATVKYNSSGVQQWEARYNGPANFIDNATAIAIDASGNVYVTGFSTGTISLSDYATIKYNSAGQQQWVSRYNGPSNGTDEAFSIVVDGAGNVYVTGESLSGSNYDFATVKYNSAGQEQWAARYNGPQSSVDNGLVVRVDGAGNVYVTGNSTGSGSGFDYETIKYNSAGQQQWEARYNGPNNADDIPTSLEIDNAGNVYVTGGSSGTTSSNDYATVKYNSAGQQQWVSRYNGPGNDQDIASSLKVDQYGNVFVTGSSIGQGTATDYATVKYNSAGAEQWAVRFNGSNNTSDEATALALDAAGNVYITGESNSGGTNYDYATIRYSPADGSQMWAMIYNGTGNNIDEAFGIVVDGANNIYVTGNSTGSGTSMDFGTIKYSQVTGVTPVSNEIPKVYNLSQNYPNPFNPSTTVNFDLPNSSQAKLVVYDMLGRQVDVLLDGQLNAGRYKVDWNASNFSSGVYFYKLSAGDFTDTKKLTLVK